MNVAQLYQLLSKREAAEVKFRLPGGALIPEHFHVTEVGRVDKRFIDCGGTKRQASSCLLQTWTADDFDHRLHAGKLASILKLAEPLLETFDLSVEVEHGAEVASQYVIADFEFTSSGFTFLLAGKQTDCLAKDKCGVGGSANSNCC